MKTFKEFFYESAEETPSVLYHVTKASNIENIQKHGLTPHKVQVPGMKTRTPRIYLFSNINSENIDMIELFQHEIKSMGSFTSNRVTIPPEKYEDVAVFRVEIPKKIKLYKDPTVHQVATNVYFVANKIIEPQYLKLIYSGPIRGEERDLKKFTKSQGIEGPSYGTNAFIRKDQIASLKKLVRTLQKQTNFITETDFNKGGITCFTLAPIETIKKFYNRTDLHFSTNWFFTVVESFHQGKDNNMAISVYGQTPPYKRSIMSLGITKKELEEILVNKFNARITSSSPREEKQAYNEMISEIGYEKFVVQ
jgi:hypothetical protein